jgi:hypothetical protein
MSNAVEWVKKVYIYLFSAIGLVIVIIGAVNLISLGLKTWILTKADVYYDYPYKPASVDKESEIVQPTEEEMAEYRKNDLSSRRQRQASTAIAMIVVGAPLFFYHWRLARKELV